MKKEAYTEYIRTLADGTNCKFSFFISANGECPRTEDILQMFAGLTGVAYVELGKKMNNCKLTYEPGNPHEDQSKKQDSVLPPRRIRQLKGEGVNVEKMQKLEKELWESICADGLTLGEGSLLIELLKDRLEAARLNTFLKTKISNENLPRNT